MSRVGLANRDRRGLALRLVLLAVLSGVLLWAVDRAVEGARAAQTADAICAAVERGDWETALEIEPQPESGGESRARAAECRCLALLETGRRLECTETMESLLTERPGWVPSPLPTAFVVESLRDAGELGRAVELVRRGTRAYPDSSVLLVLEMDLRRNVESERTILDEMASRLAEMGEARPVIALRLAERNVDRQEWEEAAALLGDAPPADGQLSDYWFHLRTLVAAGQGDGEGLRRFFAQWRATGADDAELAARYAFLVSTYLLLDPEHDTTSLLERAVEQTEGFPDLELRRALLTRYVGNLVVNGHEARALEVLARAENEVGTLRGMNREEILRELARGQSGEAGRREEGTILFRLSDRHEGDLLAVPPRDSPVDAPYEQLVVPTDGVVKIEREIGDAPLRWVLRDGEGRTVGSGAVWPVPGTSTEVVIARRTAAPLARRPVLEPRPTADGRRRISLLILDSADWRLLRYQMERGDLPTFTALEEAGTRAVVLSEPPFTAAAISAIAIPGQKGVVSVFGLVHQMGREIESMNFVGVNPVAALEWVLPSSDGLFEVLGAGDLRTVNMLRSYGPLRVGRQGSTVGPLGRVDRLAGYPGSRPLTPDEASLLPELPEDRDRELVRELVADLDTAVDLARSDDVDLAALRVDSLDLFTHAHFPAVSRTFQDDGRPVLYSFYRLLDHRLAEVRRAQDEDDLLVLLSDHGSRTALEHDRHALFLAVGSGVEPGRIVEQPPIRGIGRMLATLLGVETDWPETALSRWAASVDVDEGAATPKGEGLAFR